MPVIFVAIFHGCKGPKLKGLVPVRGTVYFQDEPLDGASVCFRPKKFKSGDRFGTGMTDSQGRFELRTIGEIGVLPNDYIVSIVKNVAQDQTTAKESKRNKKLPRNVPRKGGPVKSLIPSRYNKAETSGLEFTIGPKGDQGLKINLTD